MSSLRTFSCDSYLKHVVDTRRDNRTDLVSAKGLSYDRAMYPVLLELGPLTVYSYGVMMALGFVAAAWLLGKGLAHQGREPDLSSTLVLWAAVGGLLGARLLFILDNWSDFLTDPWSFLLTGAGFVWHGGLIGGIVGVSLCIRHYQLPWMEIMDAAAPAIAIGHGTGRIGCHLAGDGDWGPPTELPWGVAYPDAIIGWAYPPDVFVHPTPLYEMAAYFAIAAFLWSRRPSRHQSGSLFWGYLLLAGIARFCLEFFRVNPPLLGEFSQAQVISLGLMLVGLVFLFKKEKTTEVPTQTVQEKAS